MKSRKSERAMKNGGINVWVTGEKNYGGDEMLWNTIGGKGVGVMREG